MLNTTSVDLADPAERQAESPVQMMALGKRDESCDLRSDNGPLSRPKARLSHVVTLSDRKDHEAQPGRAGRVAVPPQS
jgi:hypothetical protein